MLDNFVLHSRDMLRPEYFVVNTQPISIKLPSWISYRDSWCSYLILKYDFALNIACSQTCFAKSLRVPSSDDSAPLCAIPCIKIVNTNNTFHRLFCPLPCEVSCKQIVVLLMVSRHAIALQSNAIIWLRNLITLLPVKIYLLKQRSLSSLNDYCFPWWLINLRRRP